MPGSAATTRACRARAASGSPSALETTTSAHRSASSRSSSASTTERLPLSRYSWDALRRRPVDVVDPRGQPPRGRALRRLGEHDVGPGRREQPTAVGTRRRPGELQHPETAHAGPPPDDMTPPCPDRRTVSRGGPAADSRVSQPYGARMDLGVCVASAIDDIGYAVLAEELGYSHLWFADSQLLWSDCYATMALAASADLADHDRHRRGGRRHALERGDRGGPRHAQPTRPWSHLLRRGQRQHRQPRDGREADADRRVRALHRRAARAARRRRGRRRVPRWHPAGAPPDARPRLRRLPTAHPALRLRFRAAGDGARRAPR